MREALSGERKGRGARILAASIVPLTTLLLWGIAALFLMGGAAAVAAVVAS